MEVLSGYIGFAWQGFGSGDYRGGFSDKLLEASPMSNAADASWLQGRLITGKGQVHQQWWDNRFKKGGEKPLCGSNQREGVRICERSNIGNPKVGKEEGGGSVSGTQAEILL